MKALRQVLNTCYVVLVLVGAVFSMSGCDFLMVKAGATPTAALTGKDGDAPSAAGSAVGREPTSYGLTPQVTATTYALTPQVIAKSHEPTPRVTSTAYVPTPKTINPVATQTARARERRYPAPPVDLALFKQYPGADEFRDFTSVFGVPMEIGFETNDDPGVVEAYYDDLAIKLGWQPVPGRGKGPAQDDYYLGDYGRTYVYGYYLRLSAGESSGNLKTSVLIAVSMSLPIYLGATDVTTDKSFGIDVELKTAEFSTTATPDAIFEFYRDAFPFYWWELDPKESSDAKLYWKIGESSHASVEVQPQADGSLRVKVERYYGCCDF